MDAQKAKPLRGNERIAQLMDEFPEIPRLLVIKTDMIREGIKPTPATRKIGRWALPDAHDYFEFDKEDTHTAEETAEGYVLSPIVMHFREEVSARFMFDSRSPYEVRYEERGRYRLYRDGDPLEEVFFPPRPEWYSRKTSSGKPMAQVISLRAEKCVKVVPLAYCEFGCRYCNIVSSESTKQGLGMERLVTKREEDVYETFVAASEEGKIRHVGVEGGCLRDSSKEVDLYVRIVRALKRAMNDVGYDCPINVVCQALEGEDQLKLKEAGATRMKFNLEVWDEKLFSIICPGKAKYVGREKWIERILQAKEIWGATNAKFIDGLEMAPPYGFKTEEEAAESLIQGWEWFLARGIGISGGLWRPAPGTEFAGAPSPRTEYFLRMQLTRHKMALVNKLPSRRSGGCNRCSFTNIDGDWAHVDTSV